MPRNTALLTPAFFSERMKKTTRLEFSFPCPFLWREIEKQAEIELQRSKKKQVLEGLLCHKFVEYIDPQEGGGGERSQQWRIDNTYNWVIYGPNCDLHGYGGGGCPFEDILESLQTQWDEERQELNGSPPTKALIIEMRNSFRFGFWYRNSSFTITEGPDSGDIYFEDDKKRYYTYERVRRYFD